MSGFTIPNTPEAPANQNQAEPDSLDFQILGRQNSGVVSGLTVTPGTGTAVNVASGEIVLNGVYYSVSSSSNLALTTYTTLSFFDIVYVRVSGSTASVFVQAGPQTTNPRYPLTGTGTGEINLATDVVIAAVWRDGTAVDANRIIDKRIFVRSTTSRTGTTATGGSPADTFVNTSWTPGTSLASPFSVNVGGTWYNLAQWPSSGNFSAGTITATLNGNATTASRWATARTLSLTGNASGSVSLDGSGNVTLNVSNNYAASAPWSGITGVPAIVYNNGGTYSINITGSAGSSTTAGYLSASYNVDPLGAPYIGWSSGNGTWAIVGFSGAGGLDFSAYRVGISIINGYGPTTGSGAALIRESSGNIRVSSSRREFKENIQDYSDGLEILKNLRPRTFNWKPRPDDPDFELATKADFVEHGFIVEEIVENYPELIHYIPNDDGSRKPIMWKTNDVISLLVQSVQELSARVEALEAQ